MIVTETPLTIEEREWVMHHVVALAALGYTPEAVTRRAEGLALRLRAIVLTEGADTVRAASGRGGVGEEMTK